MRYIIPGNNGFIKELASLMLQTEAINCPENDIPLSPEWISLLFHTCHVENSYFYKICLTLDPFPTKLCGWVRKGGLSSTHETTTTAGPWYPLILMAGKVLFSDVDVTPLRAPADRPSHSYLQLLIAHSDIVLWFLQISDVYLKISVR